VETELRRGTLILKGTNRKGRYDFCYASVLWFQEKGWPLPEEALRIVHEKLNPPEVDFTDLQWKTRPWGHQEPGVKKWLTVKRGALYHAMGAGKSLEALTGIGFLMQKGIAKRALILCPLSVYAEWPRQFERHATAGSLHVINDAKKGKKLLAELPEGAIVVLNYEKLASLEADIAGKFDIIVADEATKIKNPQAQRTKILARLTASVPYVLIMTGTPISKNMIDVFGEFLVMDNFWFGKSFWLFKQRYCVMGGWMGHQIVGYHREDELRKIIDFPSHRVTKQEALPHLPPKVFEERTCEMTPEQRKIYKETQKKFWIEFQQGNIDVKNAAARVVKLQEIANGFVISDQHEVIRISNSKLECLSDTIEEIDGDDQITIWCRFREDIRCIEEILAERFPDRKVFSLHGDTKERPTLLANYRETKGSVLVVQIQTGGMGLDLTCSRFGLIYSNVFEYALREQLEDRHHRPGQVNAVTYIDFITENSVDRKIQDVLANRKTLADWIMEDKGRLGDFFEPTGRFRR
jgi:SNF2 family DNA or RNA helicase